MYSFTRIVNFILQVLEALNKRRYKFYNIEESETIRDIDEFLSLK